MEKPEYQTTDLYLAASLQLHKFHLLDVRATGNVGVFVFEDQPDRPAFVRRYYSGELTGSLKAFANAWADLKKLVVNEIGMER